MKLALIVCTNGNGHTRRALKLYGALIKKGVDVTIFGPREKINNFSSIYGFASPKLIHFDSKTTIENWGTGRACNWYKFLPSLDSYDMVIGDGLLEVLYLRSDAWFIGSYLWHKSIISFPQIHAKKLDHLIQCHNPKIISSSIFTAPYLKCEKNLIEVGLFGKKTLSRKYLRDERVLLVSAGLGGEEEESLARKFIAELIIRKFKHPFKKIYIGSEIYSESLPPLFAKAPFDEKMYAEVTEAIVRPGIGTVSDCILNEIMIFPFYNLDNIEMQTNSLALSNLGVGIKSNNIFDAFNFAIAFANDRPAMKNHFDKLQDIEDGAELFVSRLILRC